MDDFPIRSTDPFDAFPALREIPGPPKTLYVRGSLEGLQGKKLIAFVGSRGCTPYGEAACRSLIAGLAGYPIVIVSGLALGIDAIAHDAALEHGITTVAFPGSGLGEKTVYPAQHRTLAKEILASGGALVSEYESDTRGAPWTFPARNRLMAGVCDMVVVIEAGKDSGTLITARLGTEYNKTVGAVPGPITSPSSYGTNWLLKMGATPVTEAADILRELDLSEHPTGETAAFLLLSEDEERVLSALGRAKTRDELIDELALDPANAGAVFSSLEIKGAIREVYGLIERIA